MTRAHPFTAIRISDRSGVRRLVQDLFDESRREPIVVISTSGKASQPYVDVEWLEEELEGSARIVVLIDSALALRLNEELGGEHISVFGGATRVYPNVAEWHHAHHRAPLIFCYPSEGRLAANKVVAAVREMARESSPRAVSAPLAPPARARDDIETVAEVLGCPSDSQVLVRTDDGLTCKMLAVHLFPGFEASKLVQAGQLLSGTETPAGIMGDFRPHPLSDQPERRAQELYGEGAITLAKVAQVHPARAELLIHPSVSVELAGVAEDLTLLLSEGDVVPIELAWLDDTWFVDLAGLDGAMPSMSILPGGPPWLTNDDATLTTLPQFEDGSPAEHLEVPALEVEEANATIALLTEELRRAESEMERQRREVATIKKQRRDALASTRPNVYGSPETQFRFEMGLSYLTRVEESERSSYALPERYVLGPEFLASLDVLVAAGGIGRDKVVDVCVDVLCGRAHLMASRAVKPWTVSKNGAQLMRDDGTTAWRVRLQVSTSGARRLKYWLHPNRVIEFDSVAVHDEGI
jgi:uncharacterized small protein (DUF1192 family)